MICNDSVMVVMGGDGGAGGVDDGWLSILQMAARCEESRFGVACGGVPLAYILFMFCVYVAYTFFTIRCSCTNFSKM